jgi:hypothetical protein
MPDDPPTHSSPPARPADDKTLIESETAVQHAAGDRQPPMRKPPSLFTIYALAALASLIACAATFDTWRNFKNPVAAPRSTAMRIASDRALAALFYASVTAASFSYIRYRLRLERAGLPAQPQPWHQRLDARVVLYAFAAILILQIAPGDLSNPRRTQRQKIPRRERRVPHRVSVC